MLTIKMFHLVLHCSKAYSWINNGDTFINSQNWINDEEKNQPRAFSFVVFSRGEFASSQALFKIAQSRLTSGAALPYQLFCQGN